MRLSKTVALVGAFHDYHADDIGGMPSAELGWVDVKNYTGPSGFFREVAKWANLDFYGRADTSDQAGLSMEGRV